MSKTIETGMRFRLILALFPLVLAMSAPAWARSLDDILPQIRAQHPGKLSDAEPWTDSDGNEHYRIKWMTPEGRIIYFDADARTGRYSGASGDEGNASHGRRGNDDSEQGGRRDDSEDGGRRSHWNSEESGGGDSGGGRGNGDWQRRDGGGDWRNHGDWHGGDRGQGDWRGGGNEGDNGGRHRHGNPQ